MLKLGCDMFEEDQPGESSVDDFLARLPAGFGSTLFQVQQMSPKKEIHPLRVFLFPAAAENRKSSSSSSAGVMQEKVISFIRSIDWGLYDCVMIQLWTPERSSSSRVVVLTVSDQPLAIGELCKGLCRYRYSCISQNVERSKKDFAKSCGFGEDWNYQAVPIFKRGNTEKRQNVGVLEILSYCPQYSKFLYFAATLKVRDNLMKSTLVEDVTEEPKVDKVFSVPDRLETYGFIIVLRNMTHKQKKEVQNNQSSAGRPKTHASSPGIQCTYSHLLECYEVKPTVQTPLTSATICFAIYRISTSTRQIRGAEGTPCTVCHVLTSLNKDILEFVRSEHRLPLTQIWAPCICDTTTSYTSLFCKRVSIDRSMEDAATYDDAIVSHGPHCVKIGNGLVGRAYSQMKCCFFRDTRQISISNYPLVAMTSLYNLTACFAIPLQTIYPDFYPIILETFLPPEASYDRTTLETLLKSLLSSVAQKLSESGHVGFQLRENEEFQVNFSNSDEEEFMFFDVHRSCRTLRVGANFKAIDHYTILYNHEVAEENLDEEQQFPESDQPVSTSEQVAVASNRAFKYVTSEMMKSNEVNRAISISTSAMEDDDVQQCFSMTVKATYRSETTKFPLLNDSGVEELHKELGKRFNLKVGRFDIKYKDEDGEWISLSCNEDLGLYVDTLKASDQSTLKLELSTEEALEITLGTINQYRGCTTQKEAAKNLGVSLSTFKRRCRMLGLKRWPFSKRKASLPSSSRAKKLKSVEIGQSLNADALEDEPTTAISIPLGDIAMRNNEIDRGNNIIVCATYKDDTIQFSLCCNSGIEELRKELDVFETKDEKYKIKYKHDDGRWITLFRDSHLSFHIEALKASRRSTMELSVFDSL